MPGTVLMVTPTLTRDGGVAAHVRASAAALAAQGVAVSVVATNIEQADGLEQVTLHRCARLRDPTAPLQERVGDTLSPPPDVIHLHHVDDPGLTLALRAFAPVLVSAHVYTACPSGAHYFRPGEECTRAHGPGCVPNLLLRGCAHTRYPKTLPRKYAEAGRGRAALAACDLAVSYSSAVDRHLADNGISHRAIVPYFPTMAARPRSPQAPTRRVVFAGRMVRTKGVEVLLRAARDVEVELVLCGDGRELAAMRALAERLGIAARTHFRGWMGAEELAQELADASIVAVPSLWPEPFGIVGIEAFAAGRPAIASDTGGIPDWLEHGVNGLAVPAGDVGALSGALSALLEDPQRQQAMGLAGRATVAAQFSGERHVEALRSAYAQARERWAAGRGELPLGASAPAPAPTAPS
jgi:glycosyltransferase involved in cell wall biosynthesis